MNILGVGGTELLIVLVIMMIVAGPKRMIHWSGILGQYVAKFRRMWAETVDVVQQEFDEAGVDIQIPRDMPTRGSLNKQAGAMLGNVTNPVKETMDEVNAEIGQIGSETAAATKTATSVVRGSNGHSTKRASAVAKRGKPAAGKQPKADDQDSAFGSWSSHEEKPDVGSWAASEDDEE